MRHRFGSGVSILCVGLCASVGFALSGCVSTVPARSSADITPAHVETNLPIGEPFCIRRRGDEREVCFPSFVHLLANPEKYHNRQVTLVGFINLEFEGNALYMSENQFRLRASHDALWLDVAHMGIKPPFQKGYVIVEGNF